VPATPHIEQHFTGYGTYVVEFRTAAGEALAISIPRGETAVLSADALLGTSCRT
jgi:hypothetical protein